jgi:hypothetical protein
VIVCPRSPEQAAFLLSFLNDRGSPVRASPELRLIGHVTNALPHVINAVVAYDNFIGRMCSMHIAGEGVNWLDKTFLYVAFHYPFVVCDFVSIIATVPGDNKKALEFDKRIGFKIFDIIKDGWKQDIPLNILKMDKEDCRWLSLIKQPLFTNMGGIKPLEVLNVQPSFPGMH